MAQRFSIFWITPLNCADAKYIIGEIFSSGGANLYKNPSDQTVILYGTYLSSKTLNPGYQLPDPSIIQTKKTQIYSNYY